jgi:membrane-associated protease RseP (regulator of RpoE activity)
MILALLALAASQPAAAAASDEKEIKEKRVVRIVADPDFGFETEDNFIFVGDDDTVRMGAFGFHRGGFIGVQLVDLTPELRAHFGVPDDAGVMVSAVSEDGPAATAGVLVGDIITVVDGEEISGGGELARIVRQAEEGDLANLEVWRDGKIMTLTATIAVRERPQVDVGKFLWHTGKGEDLQSVQVQIDDLPESVIRIDEKHVHKALGDLYTHFQSPEWQAKIKAMATERQGMEQRIHELEARLRELEAKLSKLAD